jgi:hypothetical protein
MKPAATNAALLEYTGTLIADAQARTKVLDAEGHSVPVVCLDLELDNALHNLMRAEQLFPLDHYAQAHARAHQLKKGMRVAVQAPPIDLRLIACNAAHIHVINPTDQPAS